MLYGLLGPRPAGLGLLVRKAGSAPACVHSVARGFWQGTTQGTHWRQGRKLLMGLAALALRVRVIPRTLSGCGIYNKRGSGQRRLDPA